MFTCSVWPIRETLAKAKIAYVTSNPNDYLSPSEVPGKGGAKSQGAAPAAKPVLSGAQSAPDTSDLQALGLTEVGHSRAELTDDDQLLAQGSHRVVKVEGQSSSTGGNVEVGLDSIKETGLRPTEGLSGILDLDAHGVDSAVRKLHYRFGRSPVDKVSYEYVPAKVYDDEVRPPLPGKITDNFFFIAGALLVVWLMVELAIYPWRFKAELFSLIVPFWVGVAYLVLPRVHTILTSIYVPKYFIGRSRTSDGLLGDPINLAADGTAAQIYTAMTKAGWHLADPVTFKTSVEIVRSSVLRKSYPTAPVSPLFVFDRMQCMAFQQEVDGNASQRHHVRFWRCPDGWYLPGGARVQWVAAGTYDRSVGLSLFTLQITHKIDENIDIERDYIVKSVIHGNEAANYGVIENFSTGYHSRNGGGDLVTTDGNLPVLDLTQFPVDEDFESLPVGVKNAAQGYPDPYSGGGVASLDPGTPQYFDPYLHHPPSTIWGGTIAAGLMGLLTVLVAWLNPEPLVLEGLGDFTNFSQIFGILTGVVVILLAVFTARGVVRTRTVLMAFSTIMVSLLTILGRSGTLGTLSAWDYVSIGLNFMVLMLLSSDQARQWSRRRAVERQQLKQSQKESRAAAKVAE